MKLQVLAFVFNLWKGKKMDTNQVTELAGALAGVVSSVAPKAAPAVDIAVETAVDTAATVQSVGAAHGTADKIETGVENGADAIKAALGTLGELHLINSKFAEHGTSIVEILADIARAFKGINL